MDNGDWDLSSIVRSCNATTFSNPSTFCETPPQNLTTIITPTTNSIVSPINITPSCFGDFIFNQEISSISNTYNMENDWDLSSIVRSCKATTYTNPSTFCGTPPKNLITTGTTMTTNNRVSRINTAPSCFADFTFSQENSSASFNPLKPNDFIDPNKLRSNFNSITHIPTPTTTNIPITVTTTTSSLATTTTFSTHITPNIISNINTSGLVSNQNPTFFDFSTPIKQNQMQQNVFTKKNSLIPKFNLTTSILTPKTTMNTFAITTPTITNCTTLIPTTTFTIPTTTISTQTITPTHPQQQKLQTENGKNKNLVTSVCHVKEDKLSEDQWQWRKYGQKPIKGSSLHSRSYYKCSSFKDCPARKLIEKSKTEKDTCVVTYRGKHDHRKPEVKQNFNIGTSRNKSSEVRLSVLEQAGSSQNFKNVSSPNVVMASNNGQVLDIHSKITNLDTELNENQSHLVGEVGSSQEVQKLDLHNKMMLQCDEPERNKTQIFLGESEIPYSETEFIGSYNDDDDILIPNMSAMLEDFQLEYNLLDGGSVLP